VTVSPDGPSSSSPSIPHQPRLGVALSGGTARTVAHIGVIKALEAAGIRIDCIAGTSGGSLVAALFAAGMSVPELEELALRARWKDLAAVTLPRLGFLSSHRIEAFVEETIGDLTFSQLKRPLAVVATNLGNGQRRVFTAGKVAQAVRASCSIPQIFSPCEVDGELYIDGGIVEYLPVAALDPFGPQVVIAVNLGAYREVMRRPRHILHLIMQITSVVSRQNIALSEARASFVLRPDLSRFGPFMLERASEMIQVGRAEAERRMPEVLRTVRRQASPLRRLYAGLTARRVT
jgi:NTE family protein